MSSDEETKKPTGQLQPALLAKLKRKLSLDRKEGDSRCDANSGTKKKRGNFARPGNTNATMKKRKIQIGLKVNGGHIRKESTGGGKRDVSMLKEAKKNKFIEKGKEFFFHDKNKFGPVENFTFDLENFEERQIPDDSSIAELYEMTGVPLLRCYLCAISKCSGEFSQNDNEGNQLPDLAQTVREDTSQSNPDESLDGDIPELHRTARRFAAHAGTSEGTFPAKPGTPGLASTAAIIPDKTVALITTRSTANLKHTAGRTLSATSTTIIQPSAPATFLDRSLNALFNTPVGCAAGVSDSTTETSTDDGSLVLSLPPGVTLEDVLLNPNQFEIQSTDEEQSSVIVPGPNTAHDSGSLDVFVALGTPTVQARLGTLSSADSDRVFGMAERSETPQPKNSIIDDLSNYVDEFDNPIGSVLNAETDNGSPVKKIKLHRGHVLKEMMGFYKEASGAPFIEVEMVLPNGTTETAEDGGGVLRDALSEFWEDFYQQNTTGDNVKVPCIRDNMKKTDWQACCKVLVTGYEQTGYFPYMLAQPFLHFCMHGDDDDATMNRSDESLLPTFLEYVSDSERELFVDAMRNFSETDKDTLLDVLETYQVKRDVRADNILDILKDAAHRTLIQAPTYIARCWHPFFIRDLKPQLKSGLGSLCDEARPSTKRVLGAIELPETQNHVQRETGKMLLKYIRSLSSEKLAAFMRYTTGANLMLGKAILARYVEQSDFERRPVAHTCGCVLELSTTSNDYIDFRKEFNAVLDSNVWIMDIV